MPSRLTQIAVNALQPRPVADFWCAVLDWEVVEEDVEEGAVSIAPRDGTGPGIDFLLVPDKKIMYNRLHFDLRADGLSFEEELDRLLALGARRADVGQGPDVTWVVLADPEDLEFCLLSSTVAEVASEDSPT